MPSKILLFGRYAGGKVARQRPQKEISGAASRPQTPTA